MREQQRAVVTGASRGIGHAIAARLAHDGGRVALVARRSEQLERAAAEIEAAHPGCAHAFVADVRDLGQVSDALNAAIGWMGTPTLLVNNAGTGGSAGDWWEDDPAVWWECIESIVRGAYNATRAVLPGMLANGGGRVVNIASLTGARASAWGDATSTAKTALIRQTENLQAAAGERGIRAFALHPGIVRTALLEGYRRSASVAAMLDGIPDASYSTADVAADAIARIAAGEFDAFAGRFLDACTLDATKDLEASLTSDSLKLRLTPLASDRRGVG
jgi:3-oxoacyl-[acyl-carrier protein] reductase